MSSSAKAAAGAMGSKAARACDGCLRRRARWYCAADDAFLCQACDASVHSANPLARRHERVRLRPTSSPPQAGASGPRARRGDDVVPAWFKRKPRTPRGKSVIGHLLSPRRPVVVPDEASGGESSPEEHKLFDGETDEDQELLYSVPVFDPALAELCSSSPPRHLEGASCCNEDRTVLESPTEPAAAAAPSPAVDQFFPDSVVSFGPTDAELMEFAADMEALLGLGLDEGNEEEPFSMEALGLIQPMVHVDGAGGRVKMETDGEARGMFLACGLERGPEPEVSGNMVGIDFDDDYGSPQATTPDENAASGTTQFLPRSLSLNLNYEAIIDKWEKSPWADGERPDVKLDDCWPHDYSMSVWMMGGVLVGHGTEEVRTPRMKMDGGRDARVSRYREKRRTRLFSKKIRYEVRKLNAEKRPRMKGRFVKRANGVAVATACLA